MEKKNIDWANLGFGYRVTDVRYVSNFRNGAWDEAVSYTHLDVYKRQPVQRGRRRALAL